MNQQAILQNNLLDIIFENRNKDYGAYKLRKSYQSRLSIAVFSTVGLALLLSLFLLSQKSSTMHTQIHSDIVLPDIKISNFNILPQGNKKILKQYPAVKNISNVERPPLIVPTDNINSLPATPAEIQSSVTGTSVSEMSFGLNAGGFDKGDLNENPGRQYRNQLSQTNHFL